MKEPRRQIYLQRVGLFLPPPTLISQCTRLCDVGLHGTQNVGLPTQYRFNVGSASHPIAGSMAVNRIRRWPTIETESGDCPVFALTAIRVMLYAPKGHYPGNTIQWPSCKMMLGNRLRRWQQLFQPKHFKLLTTIMIVNIFFLKLF